MDSASTPDAVGAADTSGEPMSSQSPYIRFDDTYDESQNDALSAIAAFSTTPQMNKRTPSRYLSPTTPGQLADIETSYGDESDGGSDDSSDQEGEGVFFLRSDSMVDSTDDIDVTNPVAYMNGASYVPQSPRLGLRNVLNLLAFGASLFVHYFIGIWGLSGDVPTIAEVTATHRTLITPVNWTHWIWAVIYFLESIFVLAQLLPMYRSRPVVLKGVGIFFVYSCLSQIGWTMCFIFCAFLPAFICMTTNLVALVFLIITQFLSRSRNEGRTEYLLMRFPFSLHVGWVFVETAIGVSIWLQHSGLSDGDQLCAVIVEMGLLLMTASIFLGIRSSKGLVVPAVMIWAFVGIGIALKHPDASITNQFDDVGIPLMLLFLVAKSTCSFRMVYFCRKQCLFTICW